MSDYDNTNRGVIFQPHPNQALSGQGKIDVEGSEGRYVVIHEPVKRDGEKVLVLYEKAGVLFVNDKKGNDNAPDFSGPLDRHPDHRVAAWKQEKDGRRYMSISVSQRQQNGEGAPQQSQGDDWSSSPAADVEDDIPF